MSNQETGNTPSPPTNQPQPNWVVRRVQKIKRYFRDRSAAKKQENSQDRSSRRTATATVWIALLTVAVLIVGGLQYITFDRQLSVMRGQLDAMEADQRPWIDIAKISVAKDVEFYGEGGFIELSIELTDAGKGPALMVDPWISPYIEGMTGGAKRFTKPGFRHLDQAKNILFPGLPVQRTVSGFVPADQINQALKSGIPYQVMIDVCVDYGYTASNKPHQTCHIMTLVNSYGKTNILPDPLAPIAKEFLKITYFPFGGLAY